MVELACGVGRTDFITKREGKGGEGKEGRREGGKEGREGKGSAKRLMSRTPLFAPKLTKSKELHKICQKTSAALRAAQLFGQAG